MTSCSIDQQMLYRISGQQTARVPVVLHTRVVTGTGGGPDKTILNSPRFLSRAGYKVICAFMHPPDDPGFRALRHRAERWNARLVSVPDRGPWDTRVLSQLLTICRRERVTIWHGHDYKSNALGLFLRPFWPMRLVTTVHGWVKQTTRTPLYYGIDRMCLRGYERVICVSKDLLHECREIGVPDDRCLLVENAIDTAEFCRNRSTAEAKRSLGIAPERLTVGAVGRLSAEKGFDLLIRVVDRLLQSGLNVELLVVGGGDDKPRLESLIMALGRSDRIRLLGYRADVADIYQALDVFVMSSFREGLPNVLLEAMAMEVPVVATRIAGVPRLVRHDETGWLVESGDIQQLSDALVLLLGDAGRRARLGQSGRQCVETEFSFDHRMRKIQKIYDGLLGISRSSPTTPIA